jgi:stage II sporulation protein P
VTTEDIYAYDTPDMPNGMNGIMPMDLSLSEYGHNYIHDSSVLTPNLSDIYEIDVSVDLSSVYPIGSPLVLIVHTHGTEAYTPKGINYYDPSKEVSRSKNTEENVVALGKIVTNYLNEKGIPTIHCEIMFDEESYTEAYSRSSEKIKEYLARYPSIQYVIDIHRDAVVRSSGELIKAVTLSDNEKVAQMMFVVGTGEAATPCANWQRNLALAQKLRRELNSDTDNICRPTCLRDSSYNQQYSAYSILLEIGAAGNTLEEAERSAQKAATAIFNVISN